MFSWWKNWRKAHTPGPAAEPRPTRVVPVPTPPPPVYDLDVSVQTDVGCLRAVNEDSGRYVRPGAPALRARKGALAIVADGMGGHAAGDVASSMAVDVLSRVYYDHNGEPGEALRAAFTQANRAIYEATLQDEKLRGMGTTCTTLVLRGDQAFSAHVGDSRLYLIRRGKLHVLSEDHSLVREMVKQGLISHEEARHHEDRNVITRALGLHPHVEVALWPKPLGVQAGDWFVICSDGLHDLVQDEEIRQVVEAASAQEAAEHLVALAKKRGGHDNITVGVLQVKPAAQAAPNDERDTREVEVLP